MASDILLESGSNELELLEFKIGSNCYGINVAKIKEILPYQTITPVPNAHPSIEGIFMPRDMLITLVDLAAALGQPPSMTPSSDMFIVTKFNMITIAFHVHSVEGIHRVSWKDINKPDDTISDVNSVATGIVKINNKLIIILDFEKIISDINPEISLKVSDLEDMEFEEKKDMHILLAEDSRLLGAEIKDCLLQAGFEKLTLVNNGMEAWKILERYKELNRLNEIKCVITDVEMPIMDGYHLTKLVKSDTAFEKIPVVIFSSLINDEIANKGESVGADAQLAKPDIRSLVRKVEELI